QLIEILAEQMGIAIKKARLKSNLEERSIDELLKTAHDAAQEQSNASFKLVSRATAISTYVFFIYIFLSLVVIEFDAVRTFAVVLIQFITQVLYVFSSRANERLDKNYNESLKRIQDLEAYYQKVRQFNNEVQSVDKDDTQILANMYSLLKEESGSSSDSRNNS
ncbi:MAG: hypothetical protein AAFX46_12305, partial [Cyanobacteria bacterium J06636_27]